MPTFALSVGAAFMLAPAMRESHDEELALVQKAQAGDREALADLLRRHGPRLYRFVLLPRLGSREAAEDALSETYARVIERIGQFRSQGVGFFPWLRVVGLRVALDQVRKSRRFELWDEDTLARECDEAESAAGADQVLNERREEAHARARIERALSALHPRYAEAIRLRILEEKPRADVANALGVSPATFDVVLHRAMAALRKALDLGSDESRSEESRR